MQMEEVTVREFKRWNCVDENGGEGADTIPI